MEEKDKKIIEVIDKLIADEQEAIDGYHDAITQFKDFDKCNDIISGLSEIYNEEVRHISYLNDMKKRINMKEQFSEFSQVYDISSDSIISIPPYRGNY